MPVITTTTEIKAPAERVFDLARSVDFHVQTSRATRETAIGGITTGLLGLGDEVTWRAKHFGVWQNLTSKIVYLSRPDHFRDTMVRGAFSTLVHDHFFEAKGEITIVRDVFDFAAPLGFVGRITSGLFLESYMRHFLAERNDMLKRAAEGEGWKLYLPSA